MTRSDPMSEYWHSLTHRHREPIQWRPWVQKFLFGASLSALAWSGSMLIGFGATGAGEGIVVGAFGLLAAAVAVGED